MRAGIEKVAKVAGVSPATVSRVFTGNRPVKPENAERVRAVARELGYYPNGAARALSSGRRETIGLLWGSPTNDPDECALRIMKGLSSHLCDRNMGNLMVFNSPLPPPAPKMIAERHIDGLVLATHYREPIVRLARSAGIPAVLVGECHEDVSCVSVDDRQAAGAAVKHLVSLGHRRIAYVGTPMANPHSSVTERFQGFTDTLEAAGFRPALGTRPVVTEQNADGREAPPAGLEDVSLSVQVLGRYVQRLLDEGSPPTAYVCFDDTVAAWVLQALHERGVRVPEDVSVMGFNGSLLSRFLAPPLTTMEISFERMGAIGLDILVDMIERGHSDHVEVAVKALLRERASTRPPGLRFRD